VILVVGAVGDLVVRRVCAGLLADAVPFRLLDPRYFPGHHGISLEFGGATVDGYLRFGAERVDLASISAIFARQPDTSSLTTLDGKVRGYEADLHVGRLLEHFPGTVMNRPSTQASNGSKPFQYGAIQQVGFSVPGTVITSNPLQVHNLHAELRGMPIYKSVSSIRSQVALLDNRDGHLRDVAFCPVQFQEWIHGTDVRVHVIGDQTVATEIGSTALDYRYPQKASEEPVLREVVIPGEVHEACVRLTRLLNLSLAGIDLRRSAIGEWYCFEVNPQPYYAYFENRRGAVTRAIVEYLAATVSPSSPPQGEGQSRSVEIVPRDHLTPSSIASLSLRPSTPSSRPKARSKPFIRAHLRPVLADAVDAERLDDPSTLQGRLLSLLADEVSWYRELATGA
jgi:glutathione synthase/RimK-type ligase-like ATP-grasp enzyme